MIDLGAALRGLQSHAGAATATAGPVEHIVRRRRRRRAVRRTAAGATGVVAAAAIVLSGSALLERPDPAPPVDTVAPSPVPSATPEPDPTPTTTPEPEPTVGPAVLPTGDPALPFGMCGSVVGAATSLPLWGGVPLGPGDPLAVEVDQPRVPAGSPLEVSTRLLVGQDFDAPHVVREQGPQLVVTRDGVVVAVGGLFGDATDEPVVQVYMSRAARGHLVLEVCAPVAADPAVTAGRALPAGDYELHALAEVLPVTAPTGSVSDGDPAGELAAGRDDDWELLLADPVPFTVEGDAVDPQPRPDAASPDVVLAAVPAPACGGPAPTPTAPDAPLVLEHSGLPASLPAGEALPEDVRVALRYTGPGRLTLVQEWFAEYWLVRDGVVVGHGAPGPSDDWWSLLELQHAATSGRVAAAWTLDACPEDPEALWPFPALPPGEYQLYPTISPSPAHVTRTDGSRVTGATVDRGDGVLAPATTTVVGQPVTITVTG